MPTSYFVSLQFHFLYHLELDLKVVNNCWGQPRTPWFKTVGWLHIYIYWFITCFNTFIREYVVKFYHKSRRVLIYNFNRHSNNCCGTLLITLIFNHCTGKATLAHINQKWCRHMTSMHDKFPLIISQSLIRNLWKRGGKCFNYLNVEN